MELLYDVFEYVWVLCVCVVFGVGGMGEVNVVCCNVVLDCVDDVVDLFDDVVFWVCFV